MASRDKWMTAPVLSAAIVLGAASCAWAGGKDPGRAVEGLAFLLALGVGLTAFVVWARASFCAAAAEADRRVEGIGRWRQFWIGLLNAVVVFVIAGAIGKAGHLFPPVGLLALLLLVLAGVVAFRGAMALWPEYGYLVLGHDTESSPLQATLAGGALLTGMLVFFPVGTLFFAYVVIRSLGVGVLLSLKRGASAPAGAA